jgi:long-chain acyl-CoA synthetase
MDSTQKPWLSAYPEGVPAEIDAKAYSSLVDLMQESFRKYGDRTAFSFLGKGLRYKELDRLSQVFGAYLQSLGLVFGDRVAIMLPNVLQYPIAVAAVLRAGFVVVNINPLYTAR